MYLLFPCYVLVSLDSTMPIKMANKQIVSTFYVVCVKLKSALDSASKSTENRK